MALIGCAGWNIPAANHALFPGSGSHLERYARVLPAAEINSSFHRSHRPATYARWKGAVPEGFLFSVKMPKEITHKSRLRDVDRLVATFFEEAGRLENSLGCLLVQLPPSLSFDASVAGSFFERLRALTSVPVACEPRHPSWFERDCDAFLVEYRVARVAADPALVPAAAMPGGWRGLSYYRLHGSPKIYYSGYTQPFIAALVPRLQEELKEGLRVWCIFDNTTLGAALGNALELRNALNS